MTQDEQRKTLAPIPSDADFAASPDTVREYIAQLEYEIAALSSPVAQAEYEWKQTVRDIYDNMHFGDKSIFNDPVSRAVVKIIEERHHDYFLTGLPPSDKGGADGGVL